MHRVGDLLDATFTVFRRHCLVIAKIVLVVFLPVEFIKNFFLDRHPQEFHLRPFVPGGPVAHRLYYLPGGDSPAGLVPVSAAQDDQLRDGVGVPMVEVKRIYEPPQARDGKRYLVDRLWPRGVTREAARLTGWLKDLAPSPALRRWFAHDLTRWGEFQRRYEAELRAPEKQPNGEA
jgi:uncharacterized protein YeaO (DUF488 family)